MAPRPCGPLLRVHQTVTKPSTSSLIVLIYRKLADSAHETPTNVMLRSLGFMLTSTSGTHDLRLTNARGPLVLLPSVSLASLSTKC